MHSSEHNGHWFNYNSDYSGDIHITDSDGSEQSTSFRMIMFGALSGAPMTPFKQALMDFVAQAMINTGISRLEQMETDEVLSNQWLISILTDIVSSS